MSLNDHEKGFPDFRKTIILMEILLSFESDLRNPSEQRHLFHILVSGLIELHAIFLAYFVAQRCYGALKDRTSCCHIRWRHAGYDAIAQYGTTAVKVRAVRLNYQFASIFSCTMTALTIANTREMRPAIPLAPYVCTNKFANHFYSFFSVRNMSAMHHI